MADTKSFHGVLCFPKTPGRSMTHRLMAILGPDTECSEEDLKRISRRWGLPVERSDPSSIELVCVASSAEELEMQADRAHRFFHRFGGLDLKIMGQPTNHSGMILVGGHVDIRV